MLLQMLVSSKPIALALSSIDSSGVQRHNAFELLTLLLTLKIVLGCILMLFAMLIVIVALALALWAIVTKLSSDSLNQRSVI